MERANAAQMAARSIKAKPKGRMGGRMGPRPDASTPQFAQPSQNGGGLFGGSIQSSGSFDFAAPGGMNLAAPSFGSNATSSPDVSDNEGRFAGDNRAMKRQFGGPSTMQQAQQLGTFGQTPRNQFGASTEQPGGSIFPFGNSAGAPFSNPNPGTMPASNPFSFGSQPQAANTSISFGSGVAETKPASSPFQFGQQAAQPPAISSSSFNFNIPAPQTQQAAPSIQSSTAAFNFGSTAPQSINNPFVFGSNTTQDKPAATPFLFGQSSAAPSGSAVNFGSTTATAPPSSNIFGTSTVQPAQTGNAFGLPTAQPTTNNLFGDLNAAAPPTNNLFGSQKQVPAPTGNFFGGSTNTPSAPTEPAPAPSPFGIQKQSSARSSNSLFAGPVNASSSSNNLFNGTANVSSASDEPPPIPSLFEMRDSPASDSTMSKAAPTNGPFNTHPTASIPDSIFGKMSSTGMTDLFGNVNKPASEPANHEKSDNGIGSGANGNDRSTATAEISSPFKMAPTSSLFGHSSSSNNMSTSATGTEANTPSTSNPSVPQQTSKVASPKKSTDTPMTASQPPGMFSGLMKSAMSQSNIFRSESPVHDDPNLDLVALPPIPAGHVALNSGPDPFYITDEHIAKVLPDSLKNDPQSRVNWITKYKIESLNRAMSDMFNTLPANHSPKVMMLRYMKRRVQLVEENNAFQARFLQSNANVVQLAIEAPPNQSRNIGSATLSQTPNKRKMVEDEGQTTENPSKRTKEQPSQAQAPAATASTPFKPQVNGIGHPGTSRPSQETNISRPSAPYDNRSSSSNVATPSPIKNKRKAESQITKDSEESNPLRQIKTPRLNGTTIGSNTSNLFKNILDSPSPSKSSSPKKPLSPVKKPVSIPESEIDTPRVNPFGTLPLPASSSKPSFSLSPSAPASTGFTPKPLSASNLFNAKPSPAPSNTFTPKPTGTLAPVSKPAAVPNNGSAPPTSSFKPPVFTSGPVDFLAQFGKKASEDKKDNEEKLLQKAIDEDYDSEDDLEEFKQKYREKRKAEVKALEDLAKNTSNAFVYNKVDGASTAATPGASKKIAAPTEMAPKSLFSQSTTQGSGNSVFSSLNVSRTSTPGPSGSNSASVLDGASTKPVSFAGNIFAHLSDADSGKGNDADDDDESAEEESDGDEENRDPNYQPGNDNASGPGTPASETGAGIASVKKSNFFSNYGVKAPSPLGSTASSTPSGGLFGRVGSKEPSAANGHGGTTTPSGGLFGRVGSKEPPAAHEQIGSTTPSGGLFGRVESKETTLDQDQGGTSTPGRSLFDRITKDSNGNPVRHISTEEKENTQPSTANIFKTVDSPIENPFNKTTGLPADKTWKPDSPIRFGTSGESSNSAPTVSITEATPTKADSPASIFGRFTSTPTSSLFGNNSSAPTVNITAATPTKPGNPSNLFGGPTSTPSSSLFGNKDSNPASSSTPFSNLFGNSSSAKGPSPASVGFGFGAPSVTSSLFPSAGGSRNTSRATSPGGGTDADSGVDGDPDDEVHEQINLTAGGPGEEDEEVLHEVRAKARIYSTTPDEDGNSWITKGLGPLRVLQNKDTKAVRILLRADPLGTIVLNKALLSGVSYEAAAKTVKLMASADDGKGLETWLLQIKTEEAAKELADILEKNKSS
ncbi:uncharacterized protein RCO7_03500 [Rhynchosporium graminicola]|uniref:RanBD1 domain-containing protein n=1 Tax=Rhynchosporium graminicola TaxID=2792576 RepID=A0A1E1LEL2_9HELO|nr:uncharacterized protein RCO7_03500 [Rhynchosporium commune]